MKLHSLYNAASTKLSRIAWFYFIINLTNFLLHICESSELLPNKLHSIAEVTIYNQDRTTKSITINEFVDPSESKSSLEIRNNIENTTHVVFNFPTTNRPLYFLTYSLEDSSCSLRKPVDLSIDKTRKLAEMLRAESVTLDDAYVGPVAILKSIDDTMKDYHYVRRDSGSMIPGYSFQKVLRSHPELEPGMSLVVIVKLVTSKQSIFAGSGRNLYDMKENLEYHSVTTCLVPSSSVSDPKKRYFCKPEEVTLDITYFVIADMVMGTVVGRLLEPTVDKFDFESNPFMQPLGIGCWFITTGRNRKTFHASGHQFSAEYETLTGNGQVQFIAYDHEKRLVRMDKNGRKNVYDLKKRLSSHLNEIDSVADLTLLPNRMSLECFIMKIENDPRFTDNFSTINLLGVGMYAQQSATHMGSRMIDHVNYEIYETQVKIAAEMPLIFNFDTEKSKSNLMYYITYYVEEYLYVSKVVVPGFDDYLLIPKYMELWSYEPTQRITTLLDMVTFSQFSWNIDVFSSEDTDSNLINMFSMPACLDQNSNSLEMSFLIKANEVSRKTLVGNRGEVFKSSSTQLVDQIGGYISEHFETSHLNLMRLKLGFKPNNSTNIFVEARLSSLKLGLIKETMLAYMSHPDFMEVFKIDSAFIDDQIFHIKDCQLNSIMSNEENYAVHCPHQTTCAIVWKEDIDFADKRIHSILPSPDQSIQPRDKRDVCFIYELNWIRRNQEKEFVPSEMKMNPALSNGQRVNLQVSTRDPEKRKQYIRYAGEISSTAYRVSGRTMSAKEQLKLTGLRYLVENNNYNLELKADLSMDNHLRQCHAACQIDSFCQSFSLCSSGDNAGECVLSTLLLDSNHMAIFEGETLDPSLNLFNETYSYTRDSGCNIHPKEALPSYRPKHTVFMSNDISDIPCAILSLEECALVNEQKNCQNCDLKPSNFVYCPMTSCCVLRKAPISNNENANTNQECQLYSRTFSEFYEMRNFARMLLELKSDEAANYMQLFAGLDDEQCARLCSARHSDCLAYDICQVEESSGSYSLCILHSMLSPLAMYNTTLTRNSRLVGSSSCNHRAISGLYETIRSKSDGEGIESNLIHQLEAKLRDEAGRRSENNIKLMLSEDQRDNHKVDTRKYGSRVSTCLLMVGILLGAIGFLFNGRVSEQARIVWTNMRLRVAQVQTTTSDIDLLNLPDNVEEENTNPFTITT